MKPELGEDTINRLLIKAKVGTGPDFEANKLLECHLIAGSIHGRLTHIDITEIVCSEAETSKESLFVSSQKSTHSFDTLLKESFST